MSDDRIEETPLPVKSPGARFRGATLFELGLGLIAIGLGAALGFESALKSMEWNLRDLLLGVVGCLPLYGIYLWVDRSTWAPFVEIDRVMRHVTRTLFQGWNRNQVIWVALSAGLGEELFFRWFLLGGLDRMMSMGPALVISSLLFGVAHCVTPAYAALCVLMGLYMGGLYVVSGNLLVPIVTHGVYDAVAIGLAMRRYRVGPREAAS